MAVELMMYQELTTYDSNQERFHQLLESPKDVFVHDIDGTVRGDDKEQNKTNIRLLAKQLKNGLFMVAATGRGEPAHVQFSKPLTDAVKKEFGYGVKLNQLPAFITTFNSAVTQHTFTGEVIYDLPINDDLYESITTHPFVQAVQNLASNNFKNRLPARYADFIKNGWIDPKSHLNPGIKHNWSPRLRKRYQLTCEYKPQPDWYKDNPEVVTRDNIEALKYFCKGYIPETAPELALHLKNVLANDGINVSTTTALGFNVVDIARPEVSKQLSLDILYPFMTTYLDKEIDDIESIKACGIAGGDSPLYNDRPLMTMFDTAITNNHSFWPHYSEDGPIILDFPQVKDLAQNPHLSDEYIQIAEMTEFLKHMNFGYGPLYP